jgi:hypothetical protein
MVESPVAVACLRPLWDNLRTMANSWLELTIVGLQTACPAVCSDEASDRRISPCPNLLKEQT